MWLHLIMSGWTFGSGGKRIAQKWTFHSKFVWMLSGNTNALFCTHFCSLPLLETCWLKAKACVMLTTLIKPLENAASCLQNKCQFLEHWLPVSFLKLADEVWRLQNDPLSTSCLAQFVASAPTLPDLEQLDMRVDVHVRMHKHKIAKKLVHFEIINFLLINCGLQLFMVRKFCEKLLKSMNLRTIGKGNGETKSPSIRMTSTKFQGFCVENAA